MITGGKPVKNCCKNLYSPKIKGQLLFVRSCNGYSCYIGTHDLGRGFFFCRFHHGEKNTVKYYV